MKNDTSPILIVKGDPEALRLAARHLEEDGLSVTLTSSPPPTASLPDDYNFRFLADNSLISIVIINEKGICTYVNDELLRISGYSTDEIIGKDFAGFLTEECRTPVMDTFIRRQQGEQIPEQYELSYRHKDGSVRTCDVRSAVFKDRAGNIHSLAQLFDITERKTTEAALRASEERYRLITENMNDIVYLYDMNMRIIYISPSVVRQRGYSFEDYLDMPLEQVLTTDSLYLLQNVMAAELIPEKLNDDHPITKTIELEVYNKDGSTTWNEFTNTVIRDSHGSPMGILGVGRDISARRMAEQSLKESEEKYRFIADNMTDALWIYNMDLRITYVTPSFTRMRGFTLEDVRGLRLEDLVAPGSMIKVLTYYDEVLTPERLQQKALVISDTMDVELINKDGSTIWNEITQSLIRDKDGSPMGIIGIGRDITKRRKIEEELRKSEEKYRSILENIEEGYFELDLEGNISFSNTQLLGKSGYTHDELIDHNVRDFCLPEILQDLQEHIAEVLLTGKSITGTYFAFICKNGEAIPLETSLSLIRNQHGEAVGFRGIARDITERLKVEKALYESQEDYRHLVENINDMIFTVDLNGTFTYVSPVVEQISQYTVKECLGQPFTKFIHPDDLISLQTHIMEKYEKSRNEPMVYRVINKDGQIRYVRTSARFKYDASGNVTGMTGLMSDITNQKLTEEALRKSEEKYRTILESINDSYYETDLQGNFTFCNPGMPRVSGYSREEITGKSYTEFTSKEDSRKLYKAYKEVFLTGEPKPGIEWTFIRKDGSTLSIETSVALIRDTDGNPVGFRGVGRDTTDRKLIQEAEIANRAKSQFLAHMSHEIRTPMNGIIGMAGLLLDTRLDAEQREYAETVWNSANSLLTIVNDILDFSKIEAGKLELENLDFNLQTTVDDMIDMLALRAHEKKLSIAATIEQDVPVLLKGDPGRLRQVATNLLSNAIKFTEKGEVVFRVSLVAKDEETAQLHFSIKDTGIGIAPDKTNALFTPFHQVEKSISRKYGGSGLGLSICKNLIEIMGGKIGMESTPGKGSLFWFTIPFFRQTPGKQTCQTPAELRGIKVLLADPSEASRETIAILLTMAGCRIHETGDIYAMLKALRHAQAMDDAYRIILMDSSMINFLPAPYAEEMAGNKTIMGAHTIVLTPLGAAGENTTPMQGCTPAVLNKPVKRCALYSGLMHALGLELKTSADSINDKNQPGICSTMRQRPLRILLAEDNIVNQKVALRMLEKMGHRADAVANGAEAVQALENIPYDIVLMDIQMPDMDGFEATRIIRNPESGVLNHDIHIIALTAHAIKGYMEKCMEAGMNDYITKPIQSQELSGAINRREQQSALEPQETPSQPEHAPHIFNRSDFLGRLSGDEDIMREILAIFIQNAQMQLSSITSALEKNDALEVYHQAHTLKGASGNINAQALQAAAHDMELAGRSGNIDQGLPLLEKLIQEFDRLKTILDMELSGKTAQEPQKKPS